jgi:hypothetical protein
MKIPTTIPILVMMLLFKSPVQSQDSLQSTSAINVDLSAGLGAVENFAYALTSELRLRTQHQLFTLQIIYSKEFGNFLPLIDQPEYPSPREELLNVALLYGRTYSFHFLKLFFTPIPFWGEADYSISASIGVSGFNSILRGGVLSPVYVPFSPEVHSADQKISFGIPVQLELVQRISPSIGYVHRVYYNFNSRQKFGGLLWGIQVQF